jgi:GAF domain-containing protein
MEQAFIAAAEPQDEAERLAELRRYDILDTQPEPAFDLLTDIAAYILDAPICLVSLIDKDRQWFKAKKGVETVQTERKIAFCSHAILGEDILVVPDATCDPRFAGNPLVVGAPYIRFYAGAPLRTPGGYNVGALCVVDQKPRTLSIEQARALRGLSRLAVDELELRLKIKQLQDETYRIRAEQNAAHEAAFRLEAAKYDLISARSSNHWSTSVSRLIFEPLRSLV